jgi:hypothetical protein
VKSERHESGNGTESNTHFEVCKSASLQLEPLLLLFRNILCISTPIESTGSECTKSQKTRPQKQYTAQYRGQKIGKAAKKGGSGVAYADAGCWWAETCGLRLTVSSSELPGNFPPAAPVNCLNSRILHRASRSDVGQIQPGRSPFAVHRSEVKNAFNPHLPTPPPVLFPFCLWSQFQFLGSPVHFLALFFKKAKKTKRRIRLVGTGSSFGAGPPDCS